MPDEKFIHPKQIVIANPNGIITLPNYQLNPDIPEGYAFTGIQTVKDGGALIQVQTPDILMGQINHATKCYTGRGKFEIILGQKAAQKNGFINVWVVHGAVFSSNVRENH